MAQAEAKKLKRSEVRYAAARARPVKPLRATALGYEVVAMDVPRAQRVSSLLPITRVRSRTTTRCAMFAKWRVNGNQHEATLADGAGQLMPSVRRSCSPRAGKTSASNDFHEGKAGRVE